MRRARTGYRRGIASCRSRSRWSSSAGGRCRFRPTELIGAARNRRIFEASHHRIPDIADINRLKPGLAAAINGSIGANVAIPAKRLKNCSSGPNLTEGRRIVAVGKASRTASSPAALVRARTKRARFGADRRDVDKALGAGLARQPSEARRSDMVYHLETLRPAFMQNAGAVDQRIVAGDEGRSTALLADRYVEGPIWPTSPIGLRNLAEPALRPPTAMTSPRSASRFTT